MTQTNDTLSRSFEQAEASGHRMAEQPGSELKPLIVGVAIAAGAIAVVGMAALVVRRSRRARWLSPSQPSALGSLARSVGLGALRLAVRHAAVVATRRLAAAQPQPEPSAAE